MFALVIGNLLSAVVLLTMFLAGRGPRVRQAAWFLGLINQFAWVWYATVVVPQPGILLLEGGLIVVYFWNIVKGK